MNEIEEKFYKTFGIKQKDYYECDWDYCPYPDEKCCDTCPYWKKYKTEYPPITDRILLELICILNKLTDFYAVEISYENLKTEILMSCIDWSVDAIRNEELKHQVQSLFTEGEE